MGTRVTWIEIACGPAMPAELDALGLGDGGGGLR